MYKRGLLERVIKKKSVLEIIGCSTFPWRFTIDCCLLMSVVEDEMEGFTIDLFDDILVFARDPEENFWHLQGAFDTPKKYGWRFKLPKWTFQREKNWTGMYWKCLRYWMLHVLSFWTPQRMTERLCDENRRGKTLKLKVIESLSHLWSVWLAPFCLYLLNMCCAR